MFNTDRQVQVPEFLKMSVTMKTQECTWFGVLRGSPFALADGTWSLLHQEGSSGWEPSFISLDVIPGHSERELPPDRAFGRPQ